MTIPSLLFALLIALLIGALYHFFRGGDASHLLLDLLMSVLGFAVGHLLAWWRAWVFLPLGPINFGWGVLGALALLAAADWLSRFQPRGENG